MKQLLTIVLLLMLSTTTLANDGINRKKRKVRPRKPRVIKVVEIARWRVEQPKLLTTPDRELMVSLGLKPSLPLFDVPPEPLPVSVTETEVRTYPFEDDDKLSGWWFLLGTAAIPLAFVGHDDEVPMPTPQTPSQVPEPLTVVWFGIAILLIKLRGRRR